MSSIVFRLATSFVGGVLEGIFASPRIPESHNRTHESGSWTAAGLLAVGERMEVETEVQSQNQVVFHPYARGQRRRVSIAFRPDNKLLILAGTKFVFAQGTLPRSRIELLNQNLVSYSQFEILGDREGEAAFFVCRQHVSPAELPGIIFDAADAACEADKHLAAYAS